MARNPREWNRLTESYRLTAQTRLARFEGRRTLADRINSKALALKSQFLPHYFGKPPAWRIWVRSHWGERTLPDFACLGPIKSGTSDLSAYLLQHPCIMVPLSKEIWTTTPAEWRPYYPTVREKARVEKEHGKALNGFFLPLLNSLQLIENYHAARPDAKIILMLRNPVERAWSHYKFDLLVGGKRAERLPHYRTFDDYVNLAIDFFPAMPLASFSPVPLLLTGIYVKSVQLWIDRFGRENVYVVRAEDFFKDTAAVVCGVHEFLGIPPIEPEIHPIVNQNPIKPPLFEEETRLKLREFYRPWNAELYALLGRDMEWD